ncbi:MAG: SpoIIE family protein phosphatase [Armatimonadetes bacterium]|nr:SpoIIE family protein phosphatase [Armatimonadota bacterium]
MGVRFGFRSITGKLVATFLAVFVLLTAYHQVVNYMHRAKWNKFTRETHADAAKAASAMVEYVCQDIISELQMAGALLSARPANRRYINDVLEAFMSRRRNCLAAGLVEIETGKLYRTPPLSPDEREPDVTTTALRGGPNVSDIGRVGNRDAFVVSIPTAMADGKPAELYAVMSAKAIANALAETSSGSHSTVVIDRKGDCVCRVGRSGLELPMSRLRSVRLSTPGEVAHLDGSRDAPGCVAISPLAGWKVAVLDPEKTSYGMLASGEPVWGIAMAAAALVISFSIGNRIASPIRKLSRAAGAVAVGDFRRRVRINSGDELQWLAESFNSMAESLEAHERELRTKSQVQQGLLDVTRTVTANLKLDRVAASIIDAVKDLFGASHAAIFRTNEITGLVEPIQTEPEEGKSIPQPLIELAEHALDTPEMHSAPRIVTYPNSDDGGTIVIVPLVAGNKVLGVLTAAFPTERGNHSERVASMDVLETFASCAAVAIQNAYIHGRTEEFGHMLASLRQVVEAITCSLDLKAVLFSLVKTTAEVMNAKACAILLADKKGNLSVGEEFNLSKKFKEDLNVRPGEKWTGVAFAERRPIVRTDVAAESDLRLRKLAEAEGLHGFMCAPLVMGGEAIGTINIWMPHPYRAKPLEIHLLTSIASHAAVVIANAKLFSKEYQIAETLQSSLVGVVPERLGRLVFGHKYIPALDEARVGGDLFDVVSLPNGRVALIVADVAGKGIEAAVHTGMIRYMMRAFLFQWPDSPGTALGLLNRALASHMETDVLVTVFCAIVDPQTGWMIFANAGHPPAIVLARGGKQQILLHRTGMPIGYMDDSTYDEKALMLAPRDKLLLYTDGIIEARKDKQLLSLERLQDLVFEHAHLDPRRMVEMVCDETSRFSEYDIRDDIAVVAAALEPYDEKRIVGAE